MATKTQLIAMTGFVTYAKVFNENMDANMDFHEKTEGQFNMNFYPATEEDFDTFFGAGAPQSTMGHDTIKLGDETLGVGGKYIKLKRPNKHPSGIEDFGGAPMVFDHTEGESLKKWSFTEDGELGNGTKVAVKVSIYGEGPRASIRLERIAVLNHVAFDGVKKDDGVDRF